VEVNLAMGGELGHGHPGEDLRHGRQVEQGAGLIRDALALSADPNARVSIGLSR